ncbi:MAG: glycine zipper domain-containing protein [Gemmatimonadales bacterium]
MNRIILVGLAAAGLVACGKGASQAALDSVRNLELAVGDTNFRINDQPVTPPSQPASTRPASTTRRLSLATGTQIEATTDRTISSRTDKAGETFTAAVSSDVKDSRGRVVIPAGSTLTMQITELESAKDKGKADGKITVLVTSVTVGGQTFPLSASITSMAHTLKGRGVGTDEVGKTAAGAGIGAIAGRIIGGTTKGTVIGAVVGGAAGAVIAVQTANRDVVVVAGTPMVVTLNEAVTLALR